ncbi:hypothetical protein ACJIZ3_023348 [Penstemon smallii]|uniref:Uncharacterized protein n=1 Tax=Penstemon smallii TaxID=265156 RepID=A0ABD3TNV3_9LAMI
MLLFSSGLSAKMPRTRRMRSEANKINEGWSHEKNIARMLDEAKSGNCKDVATLIGACQWIQATMNSQFNRRFTLFAVKKKLEWLRNMNKVFDNSCILPEYGMTHKTVESPLFREFRLNGEPYHLKLVAIFDDHDVATIPKDLIGSPEWPIHIRDSSDDEMSVVPYAETGSFAPPLPILLFDSGSSLSDVD